MKGALLLDFIIEKRRSNFHFISGKDEALLVYEDGSQMETKLST